MDNIFYYLNEVKNYQPVICIDNFFKQEDLEKINLQLKTVNMEAALIGEDSDDDVFETKRLAAHSVRKSNISFLEDASWIWLYDKVSIAINHVNLTNYNKILYGTQPLQYTEYDSKYNGFYKPHIDVSDKRDPLVRSLSFTIQISPEDTYSGGDVLIYYNNNVINASKKYGTITFFDSNMLHEVKPVTSGFRKSIVGWVVGPRV